MDLFNELGHLALASRLKRLGELLQAQVSEVYAEQAESFRARWFPVLIALSRTSPLSVVQLAGILGLTHTAIAQIGQEMEEQGLLGSQQDPRDGRRRLLALTAEGEATIARLQPLWEEVRATTAELVAESGHDLLAAIAAVEERLAVRPMDDRLRARIARKPDLRKGDSVRTPLRQRLFLALFALAVPALAAPPAPPAITAQDRAAIIDDIAAALNEIYVFPETAKKMEEHVRRQLASGAYDRLGTLDAFAQKLTEDLQSVSHDLHLHVDWTPDPPGGATGGPTPEQQARFEAQLRRDNYCFRKVERLAGNVGYLKLDCFAQADLGGATAVAAMGFLAGSEALIFDLRDNGGGAPSMIQLLTSYLLPGEPTHLNSFYIRKGDRTEQFWTNSWVPGARLPDVPVFVLTSGRTFSAAEEFTYNLKNLKRATLVGETTGGGAHPVEFHRVKGYPLGVSLPFGRAINPISGTNWEGTGVEPDVKVPVAEALAVAHTRALAAVAEKATDPEQKASLEFVRGVMEDRRKPAALLSAAELQAFAGAYGPRTISLEDGALWYQRGKGRKMRLQPVGQDRFLVGDLDDFRLRFERDAGGKVVRLVGMYPDGSEEPNPRAE